MSPARIALGYTVIAILWIAFSDAVVTRLKLHPAVMTIKGMVFVFVTASLLYFTIRRLVQTLQIASQERDETARLYQTVVEASNEGICLLDQSGRISFLNGRLAAMLGRPAEELQGKRLQDFVEEPDTLAHRGAQQRETHECRLRTDCGHKRWVLISRHPVLNDAGEVVQSVGTVIDITERKGAEAILEARVAERTATLDRHTRLLDALRTITAEIAVELRLPAVLDLVIRRAVTLLGGVAGDIFLWEESSQELVPTAWMNEGDYMRPVRVKLGERLVGRVAAERRGRIINDYQSRPEALPVIRAQGRVAAALMEPLLCRDRLVGAITVDREAAGGLFTLEDQHALQLLAGHAAIAIENARLYEAAQREIAERTRAEEALRQVNATLEQRVQERTAALRQAGAYTRSLLEASLDALVTISPGGQIADVNVATEAVTGLPRTALIGTDFSDYFTDPSHARAGYERAFREGAVKDYPLEIRHRDGHVTPVLYNAAVYRDAIGRVSGVLAAARDITDRKRAEEELRRLNRELRAISDCNQALLRATDEQGLVKEICRIVCDESGYRMAWVGYAEHDEAKSVRPVAWAGAEQGYLATASITWADTDRGRGPAGTAIRSGTSCYTQDYATDPRFAPWRDSALQRGFRSAIVLPLKDEHAKVFGCLCIYSGQSNAFTSEEIRLLEDLAGDLAFGIVTLRSRAAREQAEQEVNLLSFALNNVRESAFLIDDRARFQYVNEEASRVLGYARAELLGMAVPEIDPDFPAERWAEHWRDLQTQRSLSFESRHRTRDGRVFPVEVNGNYFEYGGAAYCLALVRDITERKRVEEALRISEAAYRENEAKYRAIVEAFDGFVYVCSTDYHIEFMNRRLIERTGRDATGELCYAALHDLDNKCPWCVNERVYGGETVRWEVQSPKDGRWYYVVNTPIFHADGTVSKQAMIQDITERRRAEEEVRNVAAQWQATFDAVQDSVLLLDKGFRILRANHAAVEFLGLPLDEVVGRHCYDLTHATSTAPADCPLAKMRQSRSHEESEVLAREGGPWLSVSVDPLFGPSGDLTQVVHVARDITERKRAEEALRRSEAYLSEAQRLTHTGAWATNAAPEPLYWSEELFRLYGLDPQDGVPTHDQAIQRVHPEDRAKYVQAFRRVIRQKVDSDVEFRTVLPDGTIRYLYGLGHPVLNADGELIEVVGTTVDITERKRAEEALRRSEAYLAEAQRLTHTGSWAWDVAGNIFSYSSEENCRIYGVDRQEDLDTEAVFRIVHPEDRERVKGSRERSLREKVNTSDEFRIVLPDGTIKHIHATRHPVLNDAGNVVELVGTSVDITERKRAEQALRESEMRFRTFVDHAADAFFMLDRERGTIIDVNRSACESLGYTREELVGMTPMAFHLEAERAQMEAVADQAAVGETVVDRHWHRRKDGSQFPVEVHTSAFEYSGRRLLLKVARDITDRVRAEEQRERLRELEAELAHINRVGLLGELTASIAHEIGQPLSGVVSNGGACLRWLGREVPNLEEAREAAKRIVRDGKRAGEVIARVRALTRRTPTAHEELDLNQTIQEVLALVGDEAKKESVSIQTQFADDVFPVLGDRVQLQQVVLNLVMNGIEAMSSVADRPRELIITTRNLEPDQVQVTVEDSGTGLDPTAMDKIFDPFYTTKPTGMGMGLSICRSILQAHGGRLWAEAKDGPGTSFHFTLPKYREENQVRESREHSLDHSQK